MSEDTMSPQTQPKDSDEMRPEYDFSEGVRGKHYKSYQSGTNVVFLEPDIAAVFPDSASVNQALRLLVRLSKTEAFAGSRPPNEEDLLAGRIERENERGRITGAN